MSGNPDDQRSDQDDELLDRILVCPLDHGALVRDDRQLTCRVCGRTFPVTGGIPDMIIRREE